jgi:hypothetical protein
MPVRSTEVLALARVQAPVALAWVWVALVPARVLVPLLSMEVQVLALVPVLVPALSMEPAPERVPALFTAVLVLAPERVLVLPTKVLAL